MPLPTLYELSNSYRALEDMARLDVEMPPELVKDTLDALAGDIETKGINIVKFVKNNDVVADAIDEAAKAMQARAAAIRKRGDSLKAYLQFHMQATGITRIECTEFVISLRNNPEAVKIADDVILPPEYMVTPEPPPPRPDKAKIKADLKAGKTIDGCWLEQGQRLEIKA